MIQENHITEVKIPDRDCVTQLAKQFKFKTNTLDGMTKVEYIVLYWKCLAVSLSESLNDDLVAEMTFSENWSKVTVRSFERLEEKRKIELKKFLEQLVEIYNTDVQLNWVSFKKKTVNIYVKMP